MDFFDDDDDEPQPRPPRGARSMGAPDRSRSRSDGGGGGHVSPPGSPQQARMRQIGFLVGAVVVLILIVIAFRGCLDARKDRSFENYVSDLSSITAETEPVSKGFFDVLGGQADEVAKDIPLQNQLDGDAGTLQGLLDRAKGLDAPDELGGAQEQIVLSYELRRDAIEGIAAQLDRLGSDKAKTATNAIYTQMRVLSASDILYARAKDQIEQGLADQEVVVADGVPKSQFLPDTPDYLDQQVTTSAITGAAGGSASSGGASDANCQGDGKVHGLGLAPGGTTLQPSGAALVEDGSVTAPGGDDAIEVSVQNQGDVTESNIDVTVSGDGIDGTDTIDSIDSQEVATATIPIKEPKAGQTVEITVEAATVGCEQVAENNSATFSVTF